MSEKIYQSEKAPEVQEELEKIGVEFIRQPYKMSHEVPATFWKEQRAGILKEVGGKAETKTSFSTNYRRLFYLFSAAAVLLLLIWTSSEQEIDSNPNLNLDSIELSALEEYLLDEAGNLDVRLSLEDTFYDQELWINEDPQKQSDEE